MGLFNKKKTGERKSGENISQPAIGFEQMKTVTFGRYPTSLVGVIEPVKWIVIAVDGNRRLLLTEKVIDCIPFHNKDEIILWDQCSLRNFMNNEMFQTLFNKQEQKAVLTVTNETAPCLRYSQKAPKPTKDRVFLLQNSDAEQYFRSRDERKAFATPYAVGKGIYQEPEENNAVCWWLRSPGQYLPTYYMQASHIWINGDIFYMGQDVEDKVIGVRPAVWVDVTKM